MIPTLQTAQYRHDTKDAGAALWKTCSVAYQKVWATLLMSSPPQGESGGNKSVLHRVRATLPLSCPSKECSTSYEFDDT